MATEPRAIDDLDRRLVERLRADGRESNRSLARSVGVSEATVAARLRRLESEAMVRVVALTDMEAFGFEYLAFIMVRVGGRSALDVAPAFTEMPETISVVVISGRFDILATVLARDRAELGRLVSETVPSIEGVAAVRCEFALDALRYDYTWAALRAGEVPSRSPVARGADDLDDEIIRSLQEDARSSNRRIAAALGVSEGTVRGRLRRMESERRIRIQAISDVETFGLGSAAFVGVHVQGGDVEAVGRALLDVPEAVIITRSIGEFDFMLVVATASRAELLDVLLGGIARIPGVRATETFEIAAAPKHVYTWARIT